MGSTHALFITAGGDRHRFDSRIAKPLGIERSSEDSGADAVPVSLMKICVPGEKWKPSTAEIGGKTSQIIWTNQAEAERIFGKFRILSF